MKVPILLFSLLLGSACAQFPTPTLHAIYPPGGQVNSTVECELIGTSLEQVLGLISGHPNLRAEAIKAPSPIAGITETRPGYMRILIGDVPEGLYNLQVLTPDGLSNPRLFEVSTFKEVRKIASSLEQPQAIEMDSVITGRFDARKTDVYRFAAKKDQTVLLDLLAERIDSKSDASMKLYASDGRELQTARDTVFRDPQMAFTVPADGDYLVGVHDLAYAGSAHHFYRLKISTRATIFSTIPAAMRPGEKRMVKLLGVNLPGPEATIEIQAPTIPRTSGQYRQPRHLNNQGFLYRHPKAAPIWMPFAGAALKPAEEQSDVQELQVPQEAAGQFDQAGDLDSYQFSAKKDDQIRIEVFSQRMNRPTDPYLMVYRMKEKDGKSERQFVAEADDTDPKVGAPRYSIAHQDPVYTLKVGEDGQYVVVVGNRYQTTGPATAYHLCVRNPQPDFQLMAVYEAPFSDAKKIILSSPRIHRGGHAVFTIEVDRKDGFNEAIAIEAQELPQGYSAYPVTIPAGSKKTELYISAKADAPPWAGHFRIIGKATIDGKEIQRESVHMTSAWAVNNLNEEYHQKRIQARPSLGLNQRGIAALNIQDQPAQTWTTCLGAKLEMPVKITGEQTIKNKVAIKGMGLPGLQAPANGNIEKDQKDGKVTWDLNKDKNKALKPGEYQVFLRAEGQFSFTPDVKIKEAAEARKAQYEEAYKQAEEGFKQSQQAQAEAKKVFDATVKQINDEKKPEEEAKRLRGEAEAKQAAAAEAVKQKKARLDQLKPLRDRAVAAAKKASDQHKARDLKFVEYSAPIKMIIAASPLIATLAHTEYSCKPGDKPSLSVTLERKHGFADSVEISLLPPKDLKGLKVAKATVKKEESAGNVLLETTAELPPGKHACELQFKYKFNGQNFDEKQPFTLHVEALPQETTTP